MRGKEKWTSESYVKSVKFVCLRCLKAGWRERFLFETEEREGTGDL